MATKTLAVVLFVVLIQGCAPGILYTHTTRPLTVHYQKTPSAGHLNEADGNTKHIALRMEVEWDSNGIGEIAKKNGITDIYFADIETVSVLFGIWQQQYVHIYGK